GRGGSHPRVCATRAAHFIHPPAPASPLQRRMSATAPFSPTVPHRVRLESRTYFCDHTSGVQSAEPAVICRLPSAETALYETATGSSDSFRPLFTSWTRPPTTSR